MPGMNLIDGTASESTPRHPKIDLWEAFEEDRLAEQPGDHKPLDDDARPAA